VLVQAAQIAKRHPEFAACYQRIANRRGRKIATVAVARKLLTRAYHLLTHSDTHAEATSAATTNNSTCVTRTQRAHAQAGRVANPRARSPQRHEPATSRARSFD
jgi:hypothetical protein